MTRLRGLLAGLAGMTALVLADGAAADVRFGVDVIPGSLTRCEAGHGAAACIGAGAAWCRRSTGMRRSECEVAEMQIWKGRLSEAQRALMSMGNWDSHDWRSGRVMPGPFDWETAEAAFAEYREAFCAGAGFGFDQERDQLSTAWGVEPVRCQLRLTAEQAIMMECSGEVPG
ncbi:hypothetical protein V8J82_03415 [Gymnodinialimonas sp. 2305UL16-5]|uniref:hypothetical protein n=1 Tax=Gymnodinialimonas mytili TaxID=3126503 RepID=UPI0030AE5440